MMLEEDICARPTAYVFWLRAKSSRPQRKSGLLGFSHMLPANQNGKVRGCLELKGDLSQ